MRLLAAILATILPASAVSASCIAPQDLDRGTLVHDIASTMTVIDAVVVAPIDARNRRGELLRPIRVYAGDRRDSYRIARPFTHDGGMIWMSNDQIHHTRGERVFEVLRPVSLPVLVVPFFFRNHPIASAFEMVQQVLRQAHAHVADRSRGYEQIGCERYYLRDDPLLLREVVVRARALSR